MTDDELDALAALTAAATAPPWTAEPDPASAHLGGNGYLLRVGPIWALDGAALDLKAGDPDAAFVCAAREALPRLLAEVARLREAFVRYCADDPPHATDCGGFDAHRTGPCSCGIAAVLRSLGVPVEVPER